MIVVPKRSSLLYKKESKELFSGIWEIYHNNGEIFQKILFTEGIENGHWQEFYTNGQLKIIGKLALGKEIGTWKTFFSNGILQCIGLFENGEPIGRPRQIYTGYNNRDYVDVSKRK